MKCISIFKCNPQIEVIDKSHCSLEDVPNFQNYSRSLEELFLDANKLTSLNDNVFRLTKLRRFSFSDNAIQDIPPDIAKLVNLVELDGSRNKIQLIPDQIKFLRGLQVCDFSANNIEYLPTGLVQLKNLTCLTLNYCPIKNLPDDFGSLKSLESLELRENELESLPPSITGLENLKKLDVGRNLISKLPDDIGRLKRLEYLLVDGNKLETVPTSIGRLEHLQCLDLGQQEDYGLKHLPEEIGGLTSLTDLHLSDNNLEDLPDGIRNLKNLTTFKADRNYLYKLNPNIGGCTSIQDLVLTSNYIGKLPSTIGNLVDLRSLNVDNNNLTELPPQIGNLRKLGILSLRDNSVTHLPNEIGHLESIRVMDFSGNQLQYLPINITSLNLRALWLSKNQTQPLPILQIDELSDNTKILTCYLLPQQPEPKTEDTNLATNDTDVYDSQIPRQAAVSFDACAIIDDADLSNEANFVRHDTPHPRELKARHQKLFNNSEPKGVDNASFNMADNTQDYTRDEYENRVPLVLSYQNHGYESNGLPEITAPNVESQNVGYVTKNNHTTEMEYRESYNGNSKDNNDARYYQENGLNGHGRHSGLYRDTVQNLKGIDHDDRSDTDTDNEGSNKCQIFDIVVRRSKFHKPGLGLSIAGGKDTPPYKDNDEGIFVSKVTRGGPAEAAGVKLGDKILAVNNNVFYEGITHQRAVDIFKKVKPDCVEFSMRVLRDPNFDPNELERQDDDNSIRADSIVTNNTKVIGKSTFTRTYTIPVKTEANSTGTVNNLRQFLMKEPEKVKSTSSTLPAGMSLLDGSVNKNIIYTTLVKDFKHDLGLVLENRADDSETRSNWSNIVIADIKPNSIASMDGKLMVDDRLLSVNGTDVVGIDIDRISLMLNGTERFIRIVVSRGDDDDPIGAALRNMPVRPPLGSWFSSTSNMSHRPSLIESYQRPTFGSVSSLQKQPTPLIGTKPPKPPKPSHLVPRDQETSIQSDDNPVARPRAKGPAPQSTTMGQPMPQTIDAERRAAWRRERLRSIEDDLEMAKIIAEAQRRRHDDQQ